MTADWLIEMDNARSRRMDEALRDPEFCRACNGKDHDSCTGYRDYGQQLCECSVVNHE